MKIPQTTQILIPALNTILKSLAAKGELRITKNNFVYLDIDNQYIHTVFPHIKARNIQIPNYFGANLVGAHISVIYPEEGKIIDANQLGAEHFFTVDRLATLTLNKRRYYALMVNCPSLIQIRRASKLPDLLNFKGYAVGLHITVGVENL